MKAIRNSLLCGVAAMALLAGAHHVLARTAPVSLAQASTPAAKPFTTEQLDQMLAPIALYPDSLLSQVLMAATYPLEVVEAARWSAANPGLKGDAAVKAVEQKSWDVSVKSLVAFPQVLKQMNDQLEWTQSLGDAMLAQHTEVAASIQRLRKRAHDAGNLKTTQQQKVSVEPTPAVGGATTQTIVIAPASPQVVYVPVYQPTVVYGAWPYPAYPPAYYPPYPGYGYGAALATGFIWGAAIATPRTPSGSSSEALVNRRMKFVLSLWSPCVGFSIIDAGRVGPSVERSHCNGFVLARVKEASG